MQPTQSSVVQSKRTGHGEVRTLDVRHFTGDAQSRAEFVAALGNAFNDIGFVIIRGHQITATKQDAAYEKLAQFFALPRDVKMKYARGEGPFPFQRGYAPMGTEKAKDSQYPDLKEFFQVGPDLPDEPRFASIPRNVPVIELQGFDTTVRELWGDLLSLGQELLRAIALYLKLEPEFFTEKVRRGDSKARLLYYPAQETPPPEGTVRASEHEDINLITLLIGASAPGLEVKNRQGLWVPIHTKSNEIVVNVGDMLQRLTNYALISTTHRVVNPPAEYSRRPRYSIPFFVHPDHDMSLAPLPSCVSAENPARDPVTTAGEYLKQRIDEITRGAKKVD